jgi:hypothetical protein
VYEQHAKDFIFDDESRIATRSYISTTPQMERYIGDI